MSPQLHFIYGCNTDVLSLSLQQKTHKSVNRCLWYSQEGEGFEMNHPDTSTKKNQTLLTKSWAFKGFTILPFSPVKSQVSVQQYFPFINPTNLH